MYMWDDEFYCLAAESFTGFDRYSKVLRVELALALLSDFLKKVTFATFEREPMYGHLLDPICTRNSTLLYVVSFIPTGLTSWDGTERVTEITV